MACLCCKKEKCPDWHILEGYIAYSYGIGFEIILVIEDANDPVNCQFLLAVGATLPNQIQLPYFYLIDDVIFTNSIDCWFYATQVYGTFIVNPDTTAEFTINLNIPCCKNFDPNDKGTLKIKTIVIQSTYTYVFQDSDLICE